MTEIVLFHSALGLRPGVHAFADRLRAAGHTVHTPDYFDGEQFDDLDAGVAKRDALGIEEIGRRGVAAVDGLPEDLVYAGFSLGTGPAQLLAQTRPGARAALLLHGALPAAALGAPWPEDVPLAVHTMEGDPWVDLDAARALTAEAADGELHLYPGDGHLFADPDLPEYDRAAADRMLHSSLEFLARV
jgi:dienelactone hydrolase